MKRWKVTFGLFLLLFALATTVACAETREEKVDFEGKRVIFLHSRGKTIHFSYDVPEDCVVTKEEWVWYFAYMDGYGSFGSGSNADEYGVTHFETETS